MSLVFSTYGTLIFCFLMIGLVLFSRASWAGALSLPSIMILTGMIYFYVFPVLFLQAGNEMFYGLTLDGFIWPQVALALYMAGAFIAFFMGRRIWQRDPGTAVGPPVKVNPIALYALMAAIALAVLVRFLLGFLSLGEAESVDEANLASNVNFLNLAFSAAIPLVVWNLIRTRFSVISLLILALVLFFFVLDGFRFRIVILVSASAIAYCYYRNIKPGMGLVAAAMLSGMFVSNVIEQTRQYGRGIDLERIDGVETADLVLGVGGEIGPVFVLTHLTQRPSDLIQAEPWVVAIARFVPTFLWPDKPYPDYLLAYSAGFPDTRASTSGLAGTQHAEFFMQFGWTGLPFMAFGFVMLAIWIIKRLSYLSPEARLAGMAIVPSLFGFYAQQRGYAFQFLCELIFTMLPLFWLHFEFFRRKGPAMRRAAARSA